MKASVFRRWPVIAPYRGEQTTRLTGGHDSFLINGIVFGIFLYYYGGTQDLGNVIQSSMIFSNFPYVMSIIQFFYFYCVIFSLAFFSISLIIYFFVQSSKSAKVAYVKFLLIILVEYLCYYFINAKSNLNFLKYFNVFSAIMVGDYINNLNWGTDAFITDTLTTLYAVVAILLIFGIIANVVLHITKYPFRKLSITDRLFLRIEELMQRIISRFNSYLYELYKLLFAQNALWIFVIFIIIVASCKIHRGTNYSAYNVYVNKYYSQFEGSVPDDRVYEYLQELENKKRTLQNKESVTNIDKMDIDSLNSAIGTINQQLKRLEYVKEKQNVVPVIADERPFLDIFGDRMNQVQENINLVSVLVLILILSNIFNVERKTGMISLQRSVNSRGKIWRNKLLTAVGVSFFVELVSALFLWVNIFQVYKPQNLNIPVACVSGFEEFPLGISIFGYIILCQVIRMLILVCLGVAVMCVSYYTGYLLSVIIGMLPLVPYVLYLFKISIMKYVSLPIWLDVNRWLKSYHFNMAGYIPYVIIMLLSLCLGIVTYYKWNIKH